MADGAKQVADANRKLQNRTLTPPQRTALEQQKGAGLQKIEKAADVDPKDPSLQARAAGAFLSVNEPARALTRAENVVAVAPQNPQAYVLRGNVKRAMNDFAGAEQDARHALALDPNNKEAQSLWAMTHGRGAGNGRAAGGGQDNAPPPAAQAKAPAAAPALPPAREHAAVAPSAFAPAQAPAAAPHVIVEATPAADRLKAFDLFKQAQARSALGDEAAAKALLDKAASADPANPQVLAARAQARVKLGDARGAYDDASSALMLDGRSARAYLARGAAREAMGEGADAALGDYRLAADLDPDLAPELQKALTRLGRAKDSSSGTLKPAEDLRSGSLPERAKKAWPIALIALGIVVFGGGALKLKRDSDAGAP